jgi:hypothetical protein
LPSHQEEQLGVPFYEILEPRIKRDLEIRGQQRWGEDE